MWMLFATTKHLGPRSITLKVVYDLQRKYFLSSLNGSLKLKFEYFEKAKAGKFALKSPAELKEYKGIKQKNGSGKIFSGSSFFP